MQLSSFTDYSIRVLLYLSSVKDEQLVSIADISEYFKISKNHLVKVVYNLSKLGYVETKQGKNGGIKLKIEKKQINIGTVVRQIEPLNILNCSLSFCHISPACRLKHYLSDAKEAFLKELEKYTIEDLVDKNVQLNNFN